jgi:long-subunit acyl-CoA synthetase (AMP-forming)
MIMDKNSEMTDTKQATHLDKFYHWEATQPDKVYLKQPHGDTWTDYTWGEVGNQARRIAAALKTMNFPEKSNIGIVSKNCAHWIISDLAIMMSGHVSVPFYPTLTNEKLNEVLVHSECKALFVGKLDEWEEMSQGVPDDIHCIAYPQYPNQALLSGMTQWEDLLKNHEPLIENHEPDMQDLMTIIYTSGTTGMPKGVMFTYERMATGMNKVIDIFSLNDTSNRHFSYLPLCHIAERNIVESASIYGGACVYFSESLETFAKNLQDAQPTHFLAVPRIWTKFRLGILSKMPQAQLDAILANPQMAEPVKKQLQTSLGLAQAKVILTGAAPMPSSLIDWFGSIGIMIQEVYGMTENVGACTYMPKDNIKTGVVGKPYPYVEIKIADGSGEVLMKAPWMMNGYYKHPEQTAETLKDGWLHTGDMGELDEEGFLKITGRVKDTFKTSKGEFVVPAPLEYAFATNNHVEQVCILGRGLAQPVALVVLSEMGQAADKESIKTGLQKTMEELNAKALKHEQIKSIVVVKEAWTVENTLMTPTLKVKRNVLEQLYEEKLHTWYEHSDTVLWE